MKIEICENTSIVTTIFLIVSAITILGTHGCSELEASQRAAYAAGLEEVQMDGSTTCRLGKPEGK